jgi:hypothetical protein
MRHPLNQRSNLLVDLRKSDRRLRLPAPIESRSFLEPFRNRFGFNDDQALQPIFPEPRQHHPEELISPVKPRPFDTSVENGKLLAKRKDFCRECQSGRHHGAEK